MPDPRVSIIIPAYNAARYLRAAIGSAVRQSFDKTEIIIVNDGSADDTLRIAQEAASVDSRIKVVSLPHNSGLGPARNAGMTEAGGEYFLFLDADDLLHPQAVETALREAEEKQAQIVRFRLERFTSESDDLTDTHPNGSRRIISSANERMESACALFSDPEEETPANIGGSACTALYSRIFFDEGIRFSSDRTCLSEDYLWNFECLMRCKRAVRIPATLYRYRMHAESKTHTPDPDLMEHISAYAEEAEALMKRYGFNPGEARLIAMDYAASVMRGLGKNAMLAPIPSRARRQWLRSQLQHPYAQILKEHYPARRLGAIRRAAFHAFINGRFRLLLLLTHGRRIVPRRSQI